jgi:hypothetical protein
MSDDNTSPAEHRSRAIEKMNAMEAATLLTMHSGYISEADDDFVTVRFQTAEKDVPYEATLLIRHAGFTLSLDQPFGVIELIGSRLPAQ